jgi:hypothetical protein
MDQYIEVNGIIKNKEKDLEFKNGEMELGILVNGQRIRLMDMES